MKTLLPSLLLVSLLLATTSCTSTSVTNTTDQAVGPGKGPKNGKQFVIGWVPMDNPKNEVWKAFDDAMREIVEQAGFQLLFRSPQFDAVKQNDRVLELITEDVDLIAVFPLNPISLVSAIEQANQADIPVAIFLNSVTDIAGVEVVFTVTSSDHEAGRRAGGAMVDALTKKHGKPLGKVLEVQGKMTTTGAILRGAGFHEVIDNYPEINVISKSGEWDTGLASRIIQDWMAVHTDTDGLYFHSDVNYMPAAQAALSAIDRWAPMGDPRHVIITAEDGSNLAVHAIRYGYMEYTSDFGIADLGPMMANLCVKYLQTGELPQIGQKLSRPDGAGEDAEVVWQEGKAGPVVLIPVSPITQDNADDPTLFANKHQSPPNGLSPLAW